MTQSPRPAGTVVLGVLFLAQGFLILWASMGGLAVVALGDLPWTMRFIELRMDGLLTIATGVGMFSRWRWPWWTGLALCSYAVARNLLLFSPLGLFPMLFEWEAWTWDAGLLPHLLIVIPSHLLAGWYLARPKPRRHFGCSETLVRRPLLLGATFALLFHLHFLFRTP